MSASDLAKYVARALALSDRTPQSVARTFVSCTTIAAEQDDQSRVRFRRAYRFGSGTRLSNTIFGSSSPPHAAASSSSAAHQPNSRPGIEPSTVFDRDTLVEEVAALINVGVHDEPNANTSVSIFRRYIEQCADYRRRCSPERRGSPNGALEAHSSPSALSGIDSPRISHSSGSLRQRSFGLRSSSTNDLHLMMDDNMHYADLSVLDSRWKSPTFEDELMQYCLACVEPAVWRRISKLDGLYTKNLESDKDTYAFFCLSVAKLPATDVMRNYATRRNTYYNCQNVFESSSICGASFSAPTRLCASILTHFDALESMGALDDYTRVASQSKGQKMSTAMPYSPRIWSEAISKVDLSRAAECNTHAYSRSLLSSMWGADAEADRGAVLLQWALTGLRVLQNIFKMRDPDFLFEALADPDRSEPVMRFAGAPSGSMPRSVRFFEIDHSIDCSAGPLDYNRPVLCTPPDVNEEARQTILDGLVNRGLIEEGGGVDVCSSAALGSALIANEIAFFRTIEFLAQPIAGARFHVHVWDDDTRPPKFDDNRHTITVFKANRYLARREIEGYAVLFNSRMAFTHMCRLLPGAMLTTPLSSTVNYAKLDSGPMFKNTFEIGHMLALALCNDAERNDTGRSMALYTLKRLVNGKSAFNSSCVYECALLLRIVIDRILRYERETHDGIDEVSIWSHLISPFLEMRAETSESGGPGARVSFESFRASSKRNIYISLATYLASDSHADHVRVHKRSLIMLRNTLLRRSKVVGEIGSEHTVHNSDLFPAVAECVRVGLAYADQRPEERFVPFFETEPSNRGVVSVQPKDACRALYALCASEEITDAQARQLFFDIKLMHVHALPKFSGAFQHVTDAPGRLDELRSRVCAANCDGLAKRRDARQFTMIYNALIYLNRFPATYDRTSMDAMMQNYSRVYFASEPRRAADHGQFERRQYRGTVSLGQMVVHSLFYPITCPSSVDGERTSRRDKVRYYMPVIFAPRRGTKVRRPEESSHYALVECWRELCDKFELTRRYVATGSCVSY